MSIQQDINSKFLEQEAILRSDAPSSEGVVMSAVTKLYPGISSQEASYLSRQLILSPDSSSVEIQGVSVEISNLRYQVASSIEYFAAAKGNRSNEYEQKYQDSMIKASNQIKSQDSSLSQEQANVHANMAIFGPKSGTSADNAGHDMAYDIASSIESLNSISGSSEEYFQMFEVTREIMNNMNDGFVTKDDFEQKNGWIEGTYIREAELMTCMGLYKASSTKGASDKYVEMYNKLTKMRQLRSGVKNNTPNKIDNPLDINLKKSQSNKPSPQEVAKVFAQFSKNDENWNMSKKDLEKYGMYSGNDEDLAPNYDAMYSKSGKVNVGKVYEGSYDFDSRLRQDVATKWGKEYDAPKSTIEMVRGYRGTNLESTTKTPTKSNASKSKISATQLAQIRGLSSENS